MAAGRTWVVLCAAAVLSGGAGVAPAVKPAVPVAQPEGAAQTDGTAKQGVAKQGGSAVFPHGIAGKYSAEKPSAGRMHSCLDQYKANKASGGNGGMKWIQKGGGYYSVCLKRLKQG